MKKKLKNAYTIITFIIVWFNSLAGFGQLEHTIANLVPNPSFESYNQNFIPLIWFTNRPNEPHLYVVCPPPFPPTNGSCVGVFVKADDVYTCCGVQLIETMAEGIMYDFSIDLRSNPDLWTGKIKLTFSTSMNNQKPSGEEQVVWEGEIVNTEEWTSKTINFIADHNFNYLFIEGKPRGTGGTYMVIIDNIKLSECGFGSCSRTIGRIQPQFEMDGSFMRIKNLGNVSLAKDIKIYSITYSLLAEIPDVYSVNGITTPIYFDGNGYYDQNTYILRMTLQNDCYENPYSFQFIKLTRYFEIPTDYPRDYFDLAVSRSCCGDDDFILENGEIGEYDTKEYKSPNSIETSGKVEILENVDDVVFQANNTIKLKPGFKTNPGVTFNAKIATCNLLKSAPVNNIEIYYPIEDEIIQSQPFEQEELKLPTQEIYESIELFPNPGNGIFEIRGPALNETTVEIYNMLGDRIYFREKMFEEQIDIFDQPNGTYFIRVISDKEIKYFKIVKD